MIETVAPGASIETPQQVLDLLLERDDISWRSILLELVNSEQMDPWDVNLTLLTQKYLETIRKMQEHDLKISGKILLAAAFLLKIKSEYFLERDISNLDKLLYATEEALSDEELLGELADGQKREKQKFQLIPRQPQPRSRKVSIYDLIDALQKAMESKKRVLAKQRPVKWVFHKKSNFDLWEVVHDLYLKIVYYSGKEDSQKLTFTQLLPPQAGKIEKVYTFIPMLHLEQEQKITTEQTKPFDEIFIELLPQKKEN